MDEKRWIYRLENFQKAFKTLEEIVESIFDDIVNKYYFAFKELLEVLDSEAKKCTD